MLAVTVGLSMLWSSFELPSASNTSVMSHREPVVVLLLPSWPSGTLDNERARCLSLATALGNERRMLKPGLAAVCRESDPPPVANVRSPWPAPPLSSPLAVLAFAPISHAATDAHDITAEEQCCNGVPCVCVCVLLLRADTTSGTVCGADVHDNNGRHRSTTAWGDGEKRICRPLPPVRRITAAPTKQQTTISPTEKR